jgi:glycosyltransferase involved in cell wall biosynthesis
MSSFILSIITPTLNSSLTIERYFNSLPPELSKFIEIVIVDNHSSDCTIEIVNQYKNKFSIKLYQKGDNGIYDAMNIGYKISSGKFLLFLNSDDWIEKDNFYFLIDLLRVSNENLIIFHQKRWINQSKFIIDKPILSDVMKSTIPHQCFIFSKNLFDRFGPYDTKLRVCADYDLLMNIFLSKEQPKYINVTLNKFFFYRILIKN